MSPKPILVYAIALLLFMYVALTAIWVIPDWNAVHAPRTLAVAGHFGTVLLIISILYYQPRMGCWLTLAWCALAPLDYYAVAFSEIARMLAGTPRVLAGADVFRIFLLLTAGLLSGALAWQLYTPRRRVIPPDVEV